MMTHTLQARLQGAPAESDALPHIRERMVLDHLPLVKAIAIRVHETLPAHVDLDDLVHAGILGLLDALAKYHPEKKVAFSSYSRHRIRGAILDSLRQLDWASRDMRRRHKQVEAVVRELSASLQRNPTEGELAAKLGVSIERWRRIAADMQPLGPVSISRREPDEEELPPPDYPADEHTQPDAMCAREELRNVLGSAMKVLPPRYQQIVHLYYARNLTMREIGDLTGVNESRVSQIHKSALEKMAAALEAAGISSSGAF